MGMQKHTQRHTARNRVMTITHTCTHSTHLAHTHMVKDRDAD